jgi:hypothetical protein
MLGVVRRFLAGRRLKGFRRIAPQHVAHASRWEVFTFDRYHLGYRDGAYEAHVEVDFGPTITIVTNSLQRWEPPNQADPLPAEKRQEIIDRIAASLTWEMARFDLLMGWIRSFDVEKPYEPREVDFLGHVASGKRNDYIWARLRPRLERGEAGNWEPLEVVLLAPRHEGDQLTLTISSPVHVNVGTVRGDNGELAHQVDPEDVVIRHWAILYPSWQDASTGRMT